MNQRKKQLPHVCLTCGEICRGVAYKTPRPRTTKILIGVEKAKVTLAKNKRRFCTVNGHARFLEKGLGYCPYCKHRLF